MSIERADAGDDWTAARAVLPPNNDIPPGRIMASVDGKRVWVKPPPGPHDAENVRVREQQAVLDTARLYTSTKTYTGFPCAHRQWRHPGHCAFVHGYSRSFHFVFGCRELDECGFVVDFGALGWLKEFLEDNFDHTLLLNHDDPLRETFEALEQAHACSLRLLPHGVGMEGTARWVCEFVNTQLFDLYAGRCWVISVECRENEKNSAIYRNRDAGARA